MTLITQDAPRRDRPDFAWLLTVAEHLRATLPALTPRMPLSRRMARDMGLPQCESETPLRHPML